MIRQRTLVQHYFSWNEIEKAVSKEMKDAEQAWVSLIDWQREQDDDVDTGLIGKTHNIVKQFNAVEKEYLKAVKAGKYDFVAPELIVERINDDFPLLEMLRAFIKVIGEEYAKSFNILYDWKD